MNRRAVWMVGLTLALAGALIGGCAMSMDVPSGGAALPPAKTLQPGDMASLAGDWQGSLQGSGSPGAAASAGRRANLRVTIAPDGKFTSNIDGTPGAGSGRIENGRIVFEGSASRGVATLHEGGGRQVLVGEGTWIGFMGNSAFQITKR